MKTQRPGRYAKFGVMRIIASIIAGIFILATIGCCRKSEDARWQLAMELENAKEELADLRDQLEEVEYELNDVESACSELEAALDDLYSELDNLHPGNFPFQIHAVVDSANYVQSAMGDLESEVSDARRAAW